MAEIQKVMVSELLCMDLDIPVYQRPYKWDIQNVSDLLNDISNAINDAERYGDTFKYRIGTIILYENANGRFDIVDGQQRIISLYLLMKVLNSEFTCSISEHNFFSKISQANIYNNYKFIAEWLYLNNDIREKYLHAFEDILEVIVITVNKVTEAFQLFDSQNTRGKALDPHDLLKAYHLREMKKYPYEMEHAVTKWEAKKTKDIKELFDLYLYPIWNWSHGIKSKPFTAKEIDTYKGIPETSDYTYARRASKAMPYFQITEPFISGNDFFEMVDHYLLLRNDIQKELENNDKFKPLIDILNSKDKSIGFKYARNLFYCALICYYDKFHNFEEMAIKKLFVWSFMLRVDMENLGFDSVNKYAVGEENWRYSNNVAMFSKISFARLHTEISGLQIVVKREQDKAASGKWQKLYKKIKRIVEVS